MTNLAQQIKAHESSFKQLLNELEPSIYLPIPQENRTVASTYGEGPFDKRPTWDNWLKSPGPFDNRPTWDNWHKI